MTPRERGQATLPDPYNAKIAGSLREPKTRLFSPSFSPATGLLYVAVREMGAYYYKVNQSTSRERFSRAAASDHWQIDGKQHVAIAAGHALFVFALE